MKVLIIDDHEETVRALAKLIKASWKMDDVPLEIVCVNTLADGLVESFDANLTILDLQLPDSSIEESIDSIHRFPPPVIVLSGEIDDELAARCMIAGAARVFMKGCLIGFIPTLFKVLQQDVIRRASGRYEQV